MHVTGPHRPFQDPAVYSPDDDGTPPAAPRRCSQNARNKHSLGQVERIDHLALLLLQQLRGLVACFL